MKGIYYIRNTTSSKIYIGASIDIEVRYQGHIHALKARSHKNAQLQKDFDQQGLNSKKIVTMSNTGGQRHVCLRCQGY